MELRNLQSFLRVAELGNFTKAASELGYSQAAVTVHIKQLEEELGAPLFERLGNNIALTPIGIKLIDYANQMQQINANISNLSTTNPKDLQGILRLGAVESISTSILVPVLTQFRKEYPNINISIQTAYRDSLFSSLKKNENDLIFTIGTKDAPEHCTELFNIQESVSFFTSSEHPLAGRELSVKELFDYPFILTGRDSFLERELFRLADSCDTSISSFIRSSSTSTIINLVQNNLGISFLGNSNLTPYIDSHIFSQLNVRDYSFSYYITAYRNRHKWISPQMDGFIKILLNYVHSL